MKGNNARSASGTFLFAVILILTISPPSFAATLGPGTSATVRPGDVTQVWQLNGATLSVIPGGSTLGILAQAGSTLTLDGATISGVAAVTTPMAKGVELVISNATIANSTVTSTNDIGLSVSRLVSGGTGGSSATVTNSTISGVGRGVNVVGNSSATLINSQVSGTGTSFGGVVGDGVGLAVIGGTLNVQGGTATGSNRGAVLVADSSGFISPSLTLDNAVLTGTTGSAILVGTVVGTVTNATVLVQNGSVLNSGNGVFLEVGQAATATRASNVNFTADNSVLTGDVQVTPGSIADITLRNNASVTGNMININSLSLDASRMTGNVAEPSASQAIVTLTNNASFTGSLSNIGTLNMDNSTFTGNVVQDAATPAALSLTNNARLTGTVTNAQSMTLAGTSTFAMVNDSSVGNLTLNSGTVNLRAGNAGFRTLTASSLSGSGMFNLGTDLAGHLSDLVNVTGNATGNHTLRIENTGVEPIAEDHAQQVVHTGSGAATFAVAGGVVDAGTFVYNLEQRGSDWFLVQARSDDGGGEPIISPSAATVTGLFSAVPSVWYGELATLRSRMGELRNGHDQGGAWARTYGNKFNISAADGVAYSQNQGGVSFGVDTPLPAADGQWLVGVLGGYSHSDLNMQQGSTAGVDSYYLGLYSTWLSTSGYYVDAVLKANRFHNKADALMDDGVQSKGDYRNYGVGASVEGGKHIELPDRWFVEPYAQLSTLWVEGKDYHLDNGLDADSNHADSYLGKIGTHVGRTFPLAKGGFVQPYVKVAVAREFANTNRAEVNDTSFNNDLSGTRGELGAGVAAQLSNVLQVHADLDYSNGEHIEQPWGVNLGVRYSW
ncbi:MAG: tibA 1 [Pseudomonas sp.]|nr:tibA 1 [Pseudomonas sp.]